MYVPSGGGGTDGTGSQEKLKPKCLSSRFVTFQCVSLSLSLCLLQYYPLKEVLAAEYLLEEFRPDLIEMVLDKLRPEYVRLVQEPHPGDACLTPSC